MPQFVSSANFNPASLQADDIYVVVTPPPSFIQGIPTDILFIVGTGSWGALNTPALLGTPADLVGTYGGVNTASPNDPHDMATDAIVAFQQSTSEASLQVLGERVSDGTDAAAAYSLMDTSSTPIAGITLTGFWTGILGNQISAQVSPGTNSNSFNLTLIPFNGGTAENFSNIPGSAGADSTFWSNALQAINQGQNGVRGPSQLVKASAASTTAKPPAVGIFHLSGGTDGRSSVTTADLIGSDSVLPKTGIFAARSMQNPPGLMMVSGLTDNTVYATIQAFVDSEGMVGILCLPQGGTAAGISSKQGYGIDDYNIIFVKDWCNWADTVNNVTRMIQPTAFIGGAIASLRPDLSPSNKPVYGVVSTERGNVPYSLSEIGQLESNGILFITKPCPGGNYWGMRHGRNSSSNQVISPIEYSRMTNFIGHTLQFSMGSFVGKKQTQSPTDPTRAAAKGTLDTFFQGLSDQGMIDSFLTICDLTNNSFASIAAHYLYIDCLVRYNSSIYFFVVSLQGGTTVVTLVNNPTSSLSAAA